MKTRRHPRTAAFSVVEILVAISLSAVFFTAAALVYQNVSINSNPLGTVQNITLPSGTLENFYGLDEESINVYTAPNYARSTFANHLAELFLDDVASASAVYVLGRTGLNGYRPDTIPYPSNNSVLDSPARFYDHIVAQAPTETTQFLSYEEVNNADNHTIFLIQPNTSTTELNILSLYELDVVSVSGVGNYVSVRRYVSGELTAYYDILYAQSSGNPFRPNAVHFFRRGLYGHLASSSTKFAVGEESPFYFIWWPDPSSRFLETETNPPVPLVASSHPVLDYYQMGGRTQFHFTVPAFPSLQ